MRTMRPLIAALALAAGLSAAPAGAQRTLNIGVGGAFTSLDPHYHNLTPNNVLAAHSFSPIVEFDPNFQPAPALATAWRPVGDTVWEFKMRPGVRWSDGSPFTADDIAFTFARIPQVLNSPASFNANVKPVTRIEVVDPTTIRLHTAAPAPLLPYMLTQVYIVSRKSGEGAGSGDYNTGKAMVGTGPYRLQSALVGDRVTFRRNEDWWGARSPWDTVNYRVIANNASRTAALQAGDVDVVDQVATRDVASLQTNPRVSVSSVPGQRLIYLYVDSGRAQSPQVFDLAGQKLPRNPLQDVRVRRALSLAINREGIRTQIMDGQAAITGQLMPEGASGYDPAIKPDPFDPAKARQLLAEAGYKDGFSIILAGPNDRYVNDGPIAQAIAQMWARVGIKAEVRSTPSSVFFAGAPRDEYSISLNGWQSDTGEASSDLIQLVASSNPEKGRGAILRPSHYGNPEIDAIIERSLTVLDTPQREALYRQATRLGMQDAAILPLHHQVNLFALRKGLRMLPRMQEGIRAWEVTEE